MIDRLVRGVCSGGLRMQAGCSLDEVRNLAAGMTLKEALHYRPGNKYVPLGGAKGGISCSPHHPDARGVVTRYLQAMRPLIERHWTFGEDLGLRQDLLDEIVTEIGLESSIQAIYPLLDDSAEAISRLQRAFAVRVDSVPLDQLVGGRGVATATVAALERLGRPRSGARAVVQGFGSMGGATARFLAEAGLLVVGLVDADGVVANPAGLDVEALLRSRDGFGHIDRSTLRPADQQLPLEDWLAVDTDVLVPAAVSYAIRPENQHQVTAGLVVEAANLPVLPAAEAALTARGVVVVPDFVANSAANAWWWWTLFGDTTPDPDEAFGKVDTEMRAVSEAVFDAACSAGVSLRQAALSLTSERLRQIDARFGAGAVS